MYVLEIKNQTSISKSGFSGLLVIIGDNLLTIRRLTSTIVDIPHR